MADILNTMLKIRQKYEGKPKPVGSETREEFISRCIPITIGDNPGMDRDQAYAICLSVWGNKGGNE